MAIRMIRAEETRPLRQRVLRPHQAIEELGYPGDDAPEALHLGAFHEGQLVGVLSVCREKPSAQYATEDEIAADAWRMRGVATLPEVRGMGYGAQMLEAAMGYIAALGGQFLWCNARTPVLDFYRRYGFETRGEEFDVPAIGPHYFMCRAISTQDEALLGALELPPLYPLLMQPALHRKVWGGRRLETLLGKRLPTDDPYGESWEMHDTALVANGPLKGRRVGDLLRLYGAALVGRGSDPKAGMPLLAKFLDANEWLSVQVHPNDEQAARLEGDPRGKTEAWYVIAADPGAKLVIGVRPGTTREAMAAAIRENRLEELLVYAPVRAGDVLLNNAGGIHALGPGVLIYEIQQSSDITYRLYDWGRMDLDGKPRALHIDKGLEVANTDTLPALTHPEVNGTAETEIVACPYFVTRLHVLEAGQPPAEFSTNGTTFFILSNLTGEAIIEAGGEMLTLAQGQTALIPAALGRVALHGDGARVLRSFQP